jgi:hypothetical protein
MNYAPTNHVSFFNEVATRSKLSSWEPVSFFNEVDTGKNYPRNELHHNEQEVVASKSVSSGGRSTSWKSGPNAPRTLCTTAAALDTGMG